MIGTGESSYDESVFCCFVKTCRKRSEEDWTTARAEWVGQHAVAIKQRECEVREESVVVDKADRGSNVHYVLRLDVTCDTYGSD